MAAYKQSMTPILIAILALAALSVIAIIVITAIRPEADNTNLLTNVMSILLPSTIALLAFLKSFENANTLHGNAEVIEETKAIAKSGKTIAEESKATIIEAAVIASESKAISEENKGDLAYIHEIVDGKMDQLIQRLVAAARAEAIADGANAAVSTFKLELDKISKSRGVEVVDMEKVLEEEKP